MMATSLWQYVIKAVMWHHAVLGSSVCCHSACGYINSKSGGDATVLFSLALGGKSHRQWAAPSGSGSNKKKKVTINWRCGSVSDGVAATAVQHSSWQAGGSGSKNKKKVTINWTA